MTTTTVLRLRSPGARRFIALRRYLPRPRCPPRCVYLCFCRRKWRAVADTFFPWFFFLQALQRWWQRHTSGRRGLLVHLVPSLLAQLAVLQVTPPEHLPSPSRALSELHRGALLLRTLSLRERFPEPSF